MRPRSIIKKNKIKRRTNKNNINRVEINQKEAQKIKKEVNVNTDKTFRDLFFCYLVYKEIYRKESKVKKSLYDFYHQDWKDEKVKKEYLSLPINRLFKEV